MIEGIDMALSKEDLRLLRRALDAGHALERIWPHNHEKDSETIPQFLESFKKSITSLKDAQSADLARLSGLAQHLNDKMSAKHLAAILVPFERLMGRSLRDDEFIVVENDDADKTVDLGPLTVVADNIRSAFNVGAILRTSECFGVNQVILTGYTPTPDEEKTAKTSMGTQTLQKWSFEPKAQDAIRKLKDQGYSIIALETVEDADPLENFNWPEKPAIILGNERFGLDYDVLAEADHFVRIPLRGKKNSLNVGIAFGIVASHWRENWENKSDAFLVNPIGYFRSPHIHAYEATRQGSLSTNEEPGFIELKPGQKYEQCLQGLEGIEKIWLIYQFHHNRNWKPMVMPPRGPRTKRGVFATRSPYRPNALGLTCVDLISVEGLKLRVKNFDLLDGTPILDIKPYLPYADAFPNSAIGWIESLDEDAWKVTFTTTAMDQLAWLDLHGVNQMKGFLLAQLAFEPLDTARKRLIVGLEKNGPHVIAYRTWRAEFTLSFESKSVLVERIFSGYTSDDLDQVEDKYGDKELHKLFRSAKY